VDCIAERRMFAKTITGSARFLTMPASARLLYYDLGMAADDDGVVEAFGVLRLTGASEDDLHLLADRGFIRLLTGDLVASITDWKRNNLIKKDRYTPSLYHDLLEAPESRPDSTPPESAENAPASAAAAESAAVSAAPAENVPVSAVAAENVPVSAVPAESAAVSAVAVENVAVSAAAAENAAASAAAAESADVSAVAAESVPVSAVSVENVPVSAVAAESAPASAAPVENVAVSAAPAEYMQPEHFSEETVLLGDSVPSAADCLPDYAAGEGWIPDDYAAGADYTGYVPTDPVMPEPLPSPVPLPEPSRNPCGTHPEPERNPSGTTGKDRKGKGRKDKGSVVRDTRAAPLTKPLPDTHTPFPTPDQVAANCRELCSTVDPAYFHSYYSGRGWHSGCAPITDWRAALRAWDAKDRLQGKRPRPENLCAIPAEPDPLDGVF